MQNSQQSTFTLASAGLEPTTTAAPTVKPVWVTLFSGDTKVVDHQSGDYRAYLGEAGITVKRGDTVTVNGDPAKKGQEIEPGSVIVVASKISNG